MIQDLVVDNTAHIATISDAHMQAQIVAPQAPVSTDALCSYLKLESSPSGTRRVLLMHK